MSAQIPIEQFEGDYPIQPGEQVRHYGKIVRGEIPSDQGNTNSARCNRPPAEKDRIGADPDDVTTKGIIDFERPADAVQLVGESGSQFIPESQSK